MERRTFFKLGLIGGASLGLVRLASGPLLPERNQKDLTFLKYHDQQFILAMVPAIVPPGEWRKEYTNSFLQAFEQGCLSLSPHQQKEFKDLLLLARVPALRLVAMGVWGSWPSVDAKKADRILEGWKESNISAFKDAYVGLTSLVHATWYDMEYSWQKVGYPGPPEIG